MLEIISRYLFTLQLLIPSDTFFCFFFSSPPHHVAVGAVKSDVGFNTFASNGRIIGLSFGWLGFNLDAFDN